MTIVTSGFSRRHAGTVAHNSCTCAPESRTVRLWSLALTSEAEDPVKGVNNRRGFVFFPKPIRLGLIACTRYRMQNTSSTRGRAPPTPRAEGHGKEYGGRIPPGTLAPCLGIVAMAISSERCGPQRHLRRWQSNSPNVCRFHAALGGHNDARAEFAKLCNCPLIVSPNKALITKRYKELPGRGIMLNLAGRI